MTHSAAPVRPARVGIGVGAILFTVYSGLSVTNYLRYGTSIDLTIYYQGLAHVVGLNPAGVAMKSPGTALLGDHFGPLVLVVAPLLLIWNSPMTLLLAQSAALAGSVAIFARTFIEARSPQISPARTGLVIVAVGLSVGVMSAVIYDFHAVALGSVLVAALCRELVKQRWSAAAVLCLVALTIKEDMAALIVPCAVIMMLRGRRLLGGLVTAVTIMWATAVLTLIIPHFNASHTYTYTGSISGPNLLTNIGKSMLESLIFPGWLTLSTLLMLASIGFAVNHKLLLLPLLGSIAYRSVLDNFRYWIPFYHYWVLPYLFVAFSTVGWNWATEQGRERTPRWRIDGWRVWCAKVVVLVSVLAGPATVQLASTAANRPGAAAAALALVPDGARVAADPRFTAHLAARTVVSAVRPPVLVDGNGRPAPDIDWVVLDSHTTSYRGGWVGEFAASQLAGFDLVHDDNGMLVYRRRG